MSDAEAQNSKSGGLSPLLVLLSLGAIAAVVIVAALVFINRGGNEQPTELADTGFALVDASMQSTGVNNVEPTAVTPFTLTRIDGSPLTSDDLKGKYTLLYFGYTYCPDFCPATMSDWRLITRALGADAAKFNFVMVSVDPARDTPEILTRYLKSFGENIVGATAEDAALRLLTDELGVFYAPVTDTDIELYTVNHTASQFVLNPDGQFVTAYSFATPVDVITADLRLKLSQ